MARGACDRLACLSLSVVTALMVSIPAAPGDAPDTWWIALSFAAFTLGCVFANRVLVVGATIGACVPLSQFFLAQWQSGVAPVPAIDSHLIAIVPAMAAALAGSTLRRTLVPIPQPVRR